MKNFHPGWKRCHLGWKLFNLDENAIILDDIELVLLSRTCRKSRGMTIGVTLSWCGGAGPAREAGVRERVQGDDRDAGRTHQHQRRQPEARRSARHAKVRRAFFWKPRCKTGMRRHCIFRMYELSFTVYFVSCDVWYNNKILFIAFIGDYSLYRCF